MLSKKQMSANLFQRYLALFSCPHCGQPILMKEQKTLYCENNHSFDLAKQGYVNMLTHAVNSMYDQSLFEARKQVIDAMLYAHMYDEIVDNLNLLGDVIQVLDTGCGEGTHLHKLQKQFPGEMIASGIDIAKEGIIAAAKNYTNSMWIVGDLAKSPYASSSFDAILNILSPANYDEFKRLLKPGGKVIKVVPQSDYLKELREHFYADSDKEEYSNERTVQRFKESFEHVEVKRVTATREISPELIPLLAHMTPMGWHQEQKMDTAKFTHITIDVDILIGK
ncbi:MAG: methyltransferase domain-containing protein [Kurthia sp.]|nr:methyltransferase domain-containing protein [Candidatus Kurthia equi]